MNKFCVMGAVMFMSGAVYADVVINDNPFYGPQKGAFYNIIMPIEFNTKFEQFYLRDEFGYGITDALTVSLSTVGSYDSSDRPEFGKWSWNDLMVGIDWAILEHGETQADLYASVKQVYDTKHDLETIEYNWTIGACVGRMTKNWTLAGIVELDYIKDDLPHHDKDAWAMTVGIEGQYVLNQKWSMIASVDFDFDLYDVYYDETRLVLEAGVNYNFDSMKYLGVYTSKDVTRNFDDAPMVFGGRFGVQF